MQRSYPNYLLGLVLLSLTVLCSDVSAKRIKTNIYKVLEKEVPSSKFDQEGFYKKSYDELNIYLNQNTSRVYSGGYYCLSGRPEMTGTIAASNSQNGLFSKEDLVEIDVRDAADGCSRGTKYVVVEKHGTGIYKVIAEMEAVEKAVKETRCVAKFTQVYSVVKRGDEVAYPISSGHLEVTQIRDIITGKVENIWGDRVCVKFAKGYTPPEAGTMIYFYEIKDPQSNKDVDPYVVATGQLIDVSGGYGTAVINSLGRSVSKGTSITTRF